MHLTILLANRLGDEMTENHVDQVLKKTYLVIFGTGMFLFLFSTSKFYNPNILTTNSSIIGLSIGILLLTLSFFYSKEISAYEIIFIIGVLFLGTITSYIVKGSEPIMMAMYIVSTRKINPYKLLKTVFVVNLCLLFINYILFKMNILMDYQNYSIFKHSFGYNHPNQLGVSIFTLITISIVFLYQKINKNNIVKYRYILLQIPLIILLIQSGSRGAELATLVTYGMFILLLIFKNRVRIILWTSITVLLFIFSFSIYSMNDSVNTVGSFLYKLNELFTQRIQLSNYFYEKYGITFFGQKVEYNLSANIANNYAIIDNAYVKLLVNYGLVYSFFVLMYNIVLMKKVVDQKYFSLLIPLISFIVYGGVEQGYVQYWVNFSMLFGSVFFAKGVSNEKSTNESYNSSLQW